MRYRDLLEVRVIDNTRLDDQKTKPLSDDETLKVFHGTNNLNMVISMVKDGFTGDERIFRTYSYENNNNPRGIFVTPSMKTAKEFGHIVIEFHTPVSDLEAPVWPNGTYTVQGQMSSYFDDDDDREKARMELRDKLKSSDTPYIANSDRPELAHTLMGMGEPQALFIGSIDPRSIQAVWVSDKPDHINGRMVRMKVREFLAKLRKEGIKTRHDRVQKDIEDSEYDEYLEKHIAGEKLFKPRETNITWDEMFNRFKNEKYRSDDEKFVFGIFYQHDDYIRNRVWSDTQFNILRKDMERVKKERGW